MVGAWPLLALSGVGTAQFLNCAGPVFLAAAAVPLACRSWDERDTTTRRFVSMTAAADADDNASKVSIIGKGGKLRSTDAKLLGMGARKRAAEAAPFALLTQAESSPPPPPAAGQPQSPSPLADEPEGDAEEKLYFDAVLAALRCYHEERGNLYIWDFVVPREGGDWPDACRGLPLARVVYNMRFWQTHVMGRRSRRDALNRLGFVWDRLQDEYNIVLGALLTYRELNGNLSVPSDFSVPRAEPWPASCRGMRLGAKVAAVRSRNLYLRERPDRFAQLDNLGFVWERSEVPFQQVYSALGVYRRLMGDVRVPVAFRVPAGEPWPRELWGLKLGRRLYDIRTQHLYIKNNPDRIRKLNEMGFQWTRRAEASFVRLVRAVKAFRQTYGHVNVPPRFVVPSDAAWPIECWGLRLSTALVDVRSKGRYVRGHPQRAAQLRLLGVLDRQRGDELRRVARAIAAYKRIHGDTAVPQRFEVPAQRPWPEELWGLKLGRRAYGLRTRRVSLDRHPVVARALRMTGFAYTPKPAAAVSAATTTATRTNAAATGKVTATLKEASATSVPATASAVTASAATDIVASEKAGALPMAKALPTTAAVAASAAAVATVQPPAAAAAGRRPRPARRR
ncbi:unnamed protein product [Phaeothamnion confervicola]